MLVIRCNGGAPVTFNSTLARVPDIAPTHHCCCSHITHTQGSTHTFFTPPLPFQQACIVCRGHARVVQFGLLFGGPLVHTQGHLHWSQQLHTHTSVVMSTHVSHPGKHSHIFQTPPSLATGLSTGHARVASSVCFRGPLVHTQGHLHWSPTITHAHQC